jgi:hypothetical protein
VTAINALMQRSNDIINADVALMNREISFYNHDFLEARDAVSVVVNQIP